MEESMFKHGKYIRANQKSDIGEPNTAYKQGWILVAIEPNGILVYRRKNWLEKLLRL